MTIRAAQLQALVTADTTQGQAGLRAFADAVDLVHDKLRAAKPTSDQVLAGLLRFEAVKQTVGIVRSYADAAVQAYASNERLALSLQSLIAREKVRAGQAKDVASAMKQSAAEAQKLLDWNQKLAINSPFSQEGVAQAFRMAQSYGFVSDSADKTAITAKRLTQAMIDFASASGGSEESMQRVAVALGQIQAKGKLSGEEIMQLTEAGLNVREILATAFGKTTAEIVQMQEKGLIPADKAIRAIVQSLEKDFAGAAKAQSGTITGLMNSLEDIQSVAGREFFGGAIKAVQPELQKLTDFFGDPKTIAQIREWGESLGSAVSQMVPAFTKLGTAAVGSLNLLGGVLSTTTGLIAGLPQPIFDMAIPAIVGLTVATKGMATAQAAASITTKVLTGEIVLNSAAMLAAAANAAKAALTFGVVAAAAASAFIAIQKYAELRQTVADQTDALLANNSAWQSSQSALSSYDAATDGTKARVVALKQELEALRDLQKQDISNTAWNSTVTGQVGEGDMQRLQERQRKIEELSAALQMATAFERENGAMVAARASALGIASQAETLAAQAAAQHASAILAMNGAAAQDIMQKAAAAEQAKVLGDMNQRLADLAGAVVSGHMTEAGAAAALAAQYNITTLEALKLFRAKMLLARGANAAGVARLEAQGQATTNLVGRNGPVVGAPGRTGNSEKNDMDIVLKNIQAKKDAEAAERAYAEAVGGTGTALSNLQKDLKGVEVGSAKYWDIKNKIFNLEQQQAKSAGTGGAGKAKVAEEEKAQDRIAEIAEDAGKRLVEIDKKYAEQRAEAHRRLAESILLTSADMVAQQEANDLELAGMSEEQLQERVAREKAEAEARMRQAEIVRQAQQRAMEGDAELAQKEYDIKSEANQKRQQLDEEYYERQRELAGNPEALAVLDQQYQEALAAQQQAESIRLELAAATAEQMKGKADEEKAAVIAAAREKMNEVKAASEGQRQAVISDLAMQASAATSFASAWETTASRVQAAAQRAAGAIAGIPAPSAATGGSATTAAPAANNNVKAAGGGRFLTHGLTTIIAGDNPGGVELVTVTPISGRGTTRVSGNVIRMAGGGEAILAPSTDTNPALKTPAGGGQESKRKGWGAEEDELYRQRLAKINELERQYLFQKEKMNDQHFWKELDRDLAVRRSEREMKRFHEQQTKRLDKEQAQRAQEILKQWLGDATGAEKLVADARTAAAEKTAAALAAAETRMGAERNAALLAQEQKYQAAATKIAEEGARAQNSVEAFWHTVRIADLSAANQEARVQINAEQDRRLERELDRVREAEEARARLEEEVAGDQARTLEEQARELAEREFQARRDALDDQQWKDERIASRNYDRYKDTIDAQLKTVVEKFEELWKNMFLLAGADVGKDRYEQLQKRASGGSYAPGWLLAGENGPEIIRANTSGYVYNATQTQQMLGGGPTYIIQVGPQPVGVDLKAVENAAHRGQKRALTETGQKAEILRRTR
jgi:tape measure domain-containing protein